MFTSHLLRCTVGGKYQQRLQIIFIDSKNQFYQTNCAIEVPPIRDESTNCVIPPIFFQRNGPRHYSNIYKKAQINVSNLIN